jgi:hypothetical protein
MKKRVSGMEAVIAKTGKRRMMARRKGPPGVAIMIAMGAPKGMKKGDAPELKDELDASKGEGMSKAQKIAALEEKIGYLKAELALLKEGMNDSEYEDESEMEEEDEMDDEAESEED